MNDRQVAIEPRKRPVQARSAATVDAILDSAARILGSDGLAGLNTNSVARVAGVSVGTLYQYFPGKEAILSELLRRKRERVLADIRAALDGMEAAGEEEMIARLVKAAMRNQAPTPRLLQAFDYADAALPLHDETRRINAEIVDAVAGFLELRGTPQPQAVARDIVGLTRGIATQAMQAGDVEEAALTQRIFVAIAGYLDAWRRRHGAANENGGPRPATS